MTIDDLPTFIVHKVDRDRAAGVVDRLLGMDEGYLGNLLLPDGRFVHGRFVNVDLELLGAAFLPASADEIALLEEGQTCRRFDGYWGARAALVLDRVRRWTERRFESVDAVAYERPGNTLVGRARDAGPPEGGSLIEGGWDHEHCDLCSEKIWAETNPIAMFSEPHHWIAKRATRTSATVYGLRTHHCAQSCRSGGGSGILPVAKEKNLQRDGLTPPSAARRFKPAYRLRGRGGSEAPWLRWSLGWEESAAPMQ